MLVQVWRLMEPESACASLSLPSSYPQHIASSTSSTSDVGDSAAALSSRLLCFAKSCNLATSASKPSVVSSDSGIFTDTSTSASEQIGDTEASCSRSVQSVERLDSCVERPSSAVRCSSSSADRPTSALARGVQIVEYPRWNPKPLALSGEESLVLMEEYLCPRRLVKLCSVYLLMLNTCCSGHLV